MHSSYSSRSEADTLRLGRALARGLEQGDILLLRGPLGAGKTVLVRGLVDGLDPQMTRLVASQSYVIAGRYETTPAVVHLDLYRVASTEELLSLGYEELVYGSAIVVVEWPELLAPLLEPDDPVLDVSFDLGTLPTDRAIRLDSASERLVRVAARAASDADARD